MWNAVEEQPHFLRQQLSRPVVGLLQLRDIASLTSPLVFSSVIDVRT